MYKDMLESIRSLFRFEFKKNRQSRSESIITGIVSGSVDFHADRAGAMFDLHSKMALTAKRLEGMASRKGATSHAWTTGFISGTSSITLYIIRMLVKDIPGLYISGETSLSL
ncbi:MAG: hypothetical protein ACLRH0_10965 [Blautia wexlerae]